MRIALGVSYDGSAFAGWQSQPSGDTVQDHLEAALAGIAGARVRVTAAGRTDAGVHALGQVAHFDTAATRPEQAWVRGVNALLPKKIAVQWACPIDAAFHARFSATGRRYLYVLCNQPVRPALGADGVGWHHAPLDGAAMRLAAAALVGEHDFSAFRSAECQSKNPVKKLEQLEIRECPPYLLFDFTASAFLHHMVRNMVGALVEVGRGKQSPEWLAAVLAGRDRTRAARTFSAAGLYLVSVRYEARWRLPAFSPIMPFLP